VSIVPASANLLIKGVIEKGFDSEQLAANGYYRELASRLKSLQRYIV